MYPSDWLPSFPGKEGLCCSRDIVPGRYPLIKPSPGYCSCYQLFFKILFGNGFKNFSFLEKGIFSSEKGFAKLLRQFFRKTLKKVPRKISQKSIAKLF
jgi:hypothetical protein